jgi:uncharacterized protein (DUF1697 family)
MSTLVLLLRGINVGKAKQVPMAALQALLTDAGYAGVRTHLRSGNVVLQADAAPAVVARDASARIEAHFGFAVGVVARTAQELEATVRADPLGALATNPSRHMVAFLDVVPPAALVASLEDAQAGDEAFGVIGHDIHLWLPDGVTGSPLNKVLTPARVGGLVTVRNWNTVLKLVELASS